LRTDARQDPRIGDDLGDAVRSLAQVRRAGVPVMDRLLLSLRVPSKLQSAYNLLAAAPAGSSP
jgi:hypothetical protein